MHKPSDLVVPAGGRLEPGSLSSLMRPATTPGFSMIDLRGLGWVTPYGLVALAIFAESQQRLGLVPTLIGPADHSVAAYVERMGAGDAIAGLGGTHDLITVRRHDVGTRLIELQRFDSETTVEDLAAMVYDRLSARDRAAAGALHKSICELGQNVTQHSGLASGYVAAQTTYDGSRVTFSIGDCGIGLRGSLTQFGFANDAEALSAVMDGGYSSTGDAGRGNGFRDARLLLIRNGGTLHAQSGTASVTSTAVTSRRFDAPLNPLRGTILQGAVDC